MEDIVCFVSLTLLDQIQVINLFSSYLTINDQYNKLCWFLKYINLFSNLVQTRGVDVDIVCPVECNSCSGQERSPILDLL